MTESSEDAHDRQTVAELGAVLRADGQGPPAWAWFVPGRVEIFGKHTDYAGGRSLVAALPRGFTVVARPRPDPVVTAYDARWGVRTDVSLADESRAFRGWANYVAVVARRLARNFPGADLGTDLVFRSTLPRAAGLSSSSALVVAVATALVRRGGLEARDEYRASIRSLFDLAGYLGAAENGLSFGLLDGREGVGTHGGSEDHTAILASRADHVAAFSYVPVQPLADVRMPASWRFVIMGSGVEADKAGSLRERYNRASLATGALSARARVLGAPLELPLGAVLRKHPEWCDALRKEVARDGAAGFSADELVRRLDHFVAEDARVPAGVEAFRAADTAAVGALALSSQRDAAELLGNQIPETVGLTGAALDAGAFAASSFGAGFGGSVWALADADRAEAVGRDWQAAYGRRFPARTPLTWFVARPSRPVTELAIES
jgi:galactokinase